MSFSSHTVVVIHCDVGDPGCHEETRIETDSYLRARAMARSRGWSCYATANRDVCPVCSKPARRLCTETMTRDPLARSHDAPP